MPRTEYLLLHSCIPDYETMYGTVCSLQMHLIWVKGCVRDQLLKCTVDWTGRSVHFTILRLQYFLVEVETSGQIRV